MLSDEVLSKKKVLSFKGKPKDKKTEKAIEKKLAEIAIESFASLHIPMKPATESG